MRTEGLFLSPDPKISLQHGAWMHGVGQYQR